MLRCMGMVPRMTAPPMEYPAITRTDKHAKPVDETGKKLDVPKSLVLCVFRPLP